MKRVVIMLLGGFVLTGCFVVRRDFVPLGPMMNQGSGWFDNSEFSSNGEQIYFTAVNDRGQPIRYSGGPNFRGMMMGMGTNLSCASCHGADGRGGVHTMHMDVMDAPDIRYSTLTGEGDAHEGDEAHGDEHGAYDLDDFRLAVNGGVHPDGKPLSKEMPLWLIKDQDMKDLFEYLKTLP